MPVLEARLRKLERVFRAVASPLKIILCEDGDDVSEIAAKEAVGSGKVIIVEFVRPVGAQERVMLLPSADHHPAPRSLDAAATIPPGPPCIVNLSDSVVRSGPSAEALR